MRHMPRLFQQSGLSQQSILCLVSWRLVGRIQAWPGDKHQATSIALKEQQAGPSHFRL